MVEPIKTGATITGRPGNITATGKKRTTPSPGSPSSTYDRTQFGRWIDADGDCQNTRQEALIEERRIPVTFKTTRQCEVRFGKWHDDAYTGRVFIDPSMLHVDHVVPLKEPSYLGQTNGVARRKFDIPMISRIKILPVGCLLMKRIIRSTSRSGLRSRRREDSHWTLSKPASFKASFRN